MSTQLIEKITTSDIDENEKQHIGIGDTETMLVPENSIALCGASYKNAATKETCKECEFKAKSGWGGYYHSGNWINL